MAFEKLRQQKEENKLESQEELIAENPRKIIADSKAFSPEEMQSLEDFICGIETMRIAAPEEYANYIKDPSRLLISARARLDLVNRDFTDDNIRKFHDLRIRSKLGKIKEEEKKELEKFQKMAEK